MNDQPGQPTENDETTPDPQAPEPPGGSAPRRLLRSRSERMIAGVAGGIAEYLSVDPTLVRVGFVVAAFFGGIGIVAYPILALVVPEDDGTGRPARGQRLSPWMIAAAILAVIVLLPGPFWVDWGGGWWWGWGGGWLLLLAAAALIAYLVLRDRDRRSEPPVGPEVGGEPPTAPTARLDSEDAGQGGAGEPPTPPTGEAAAPGGHPPVPGAGLHPAVRVIAIVVLVGAALAWALALAAASAWTVAVGQGAIAAIAVIAIGAALVVSAFVGRLRWLIVPALVIALPAGAVAASDIRFDGSIGERVHRPATIADIPADGYRLGVGELVIDLQSMPWRRGDRLEVESDLGVGQTIVSVPSNVCVETDARASVGVVEVRGERSVGVDADLVEDPPAGRAPRLVLDARVDVGRLAVSDRPPEEIRDDHRSDGDDAGERLAARQACEA